MKKLLMSVLLILGLFVSGCDGSTNRQSNGMQSYKHVHLQIDSKCAHDDVISYAYDMDGTMVEVNTKTYGWVMINSGYMLYNSDRCPVCGK